MAIAGAFGCFADVKPHKSKYVSSLSCVVYLSNA